MHLTFRRRRGSLLAPFLVLALLAGTLAMAAGPVPADELPDEVRWALEDIYGYDRSRWPLPLMRRDLDGDGVAELIAPERGCRELDDCEVDLFLCRKRAGTDCEEYCYGGSGRLRVFREMTAGLKCERTC